MKTIKEKEYLRGYKAGVTKQLKESDFNNFITPNKKTELIRKDTRERTLKDVVKLIDEGDSFVTVEVFKVWLKARIEG